MMDKSWITLPRSSPRYLVGLNQFLDFAFARASVREQIACPCEKCMFTRWQSREEVFRHCVKKPFPRYYVVWIHHGEGDNDFVEVGSSSQVGMQVNESDDDQDEDVAHPIINNDVGEALGMEEDHGDGDGGVEGPEAAYLQNEAARSFFELMEEGETPLYPGNRY